MNLFLYWFNERCHHYWRWFKWLDDCLLPKAKGINALLLEGRGRTGRRIHTLAAPPNDTPVEMGATWFADKHIYLMSLVKELNLSIFPQFHDGLCIYETVLARPPQLFTMPANEPPSYRIAAAVPR
ncbi:MAG TPA: FAD-dependent oxidoreductase [Flavisolibacter sp.]|nr:FAD-dependent oxidoreductase [Flavisolibacter sp.]